jgi:hypothetical protein
MASEDPKMSKQYPAGNRKRLTLMIHQNFKYFGGLNIALSSVNNIKMEGPIMIIYNLKRKCEAPLTVTEI